MVRAKLADGSYTASLKVMFGTDPYFVPIKRTSRAHGPRKPVATMDDHLHLQTYFHPCTLNSEIRTITYRPAGGNDLDDIRKFVDFWLSGGAKKLGIEGAGADYFVPKGQQIGYLKYKTVYLATFEDKIIGWTVKSKNDTMIHLLVCPEYRGRGIGGHLLSIIDPACIRSKSDQTTGDPLKFYQKHGYEVTEAKTGKHQNIDLMQKHEI